MNVDTIDLSSEDSNDSDNKLLLPKVKFPKKKLEEVKSTQYESSNEISSSSQKKSRRNKNGTVGVKNKTTSADRQALKKRMAEEKKAMKNSNKIYKPGECMKVQLTPTSQHCSHGLYINTAEDIESMVASHQLSQYVERAKQLAGCELTLVLFGIKDYFKASGRKTANNRHKLMTEIELEKAITDLLVTSDCDTIIVNTPNELALTITQFTKAIAEEPFKKSKRALDEQADFYMRGDNKKCVSVDKDGNGLSRLWQQMIAVLPLSSLETSRALCAEYKTPQALYEAIESHGVAAVADIGVTRAAAPGARARRVGPEFARRLRTLLTADDGSVLID